MEADKKAGRKPNPKTWDINLRHEFRSSYLQDTDIHTLMYLSGGNFTEVIQTALKEFVIKHKLPTNNHDFQSSIYLQVAKHVSENKAHPTVTEVLEAIGQSHVYDMIMAATNLGAIDKTAPAARKSAYTPKSTRPEPDAKTKSVQQHSVQTSPAFLEPATNLSSLDLGPEIDETDDEPVTVKPSLKDRFLKNHNYDA